MTAKNKIRMAKRDKEQTMKHCYIEGKSKTTLFREVPCVTVHEKHIKKYYNAQGWSEALDWIENNFIFKLGVTTREWIGETDENNR